MLADAQTSDALGSDTLFNSSLLFNTTLKIAQRFLSLPSRALARLRRLDDMALELHVAAQTTRQATSSGTPGYRRHRNAGHVGIAPMPGPWGFLTSGYFLGLFVMAFVLNRIQNIVVPPRRPQAFRLHPNHADYPGRRPMSLRRAMLSTMFPINFSSTFSRAIFRWPSMYFLGRSVVMWLVLLLHAHDQTLFARSAWLGSLGDRVLSKSMEDICWYTFMSACLALCVGTLTTGLEGLNINDSAPFNLFAFAFQLYVETASHPAKEGEESTRPNTHVIVTIILPLFQLTVMHCLEIQRRWSHYRLALSAANGLLALLHFHYVVWLSPTPFPLTTYAARVVESAMLAIIALTVTLNALTQLLAEGQLVRPLFGHTALMPKGDEDFNVALFRLGTASMEATAVAGLGNEVGGVTSARPADVARAHQHEMQLVRGELEIDRGGVAALRPAYEQRGKRRVPRKGFANEISDVKVRAASTDFWVNTVLNVAWHRDFGSFLASVWRAVRRVWAAAVEKARGSARERGREPSVLIVDGPGQRSEVDEDPYERFIRGEPVSDDEDDDFHPDEGTPRPETDSGGSGDEDEEEDADEGDEAGEQAQLYADLSRSDAGSAPLLLAHMTDQSASPLTRRGYRKLVNGPETRNTGDVDDWEDFVADRRTAKRMALPNADEDPASQNARACVICTVEARDVICWPCRCLALCDDCRNNLASRSSASKHTCPCCRRSVEGYSKIYIP